MVIISKVWQQLSKELRGCVFLGVSNDDVTSFTLMKPTVNKGFEKTVGATRSISFQYKSQF